MQSGFSRMTRLWAGLSTAALGWFVGGLALADGVAGRPVDGEMGMQPGVTDIRHDQVWFYNFLFIIITGISLFVLGLLLFIIVRFNKRANPTPAKFSHNTPIEIAWTIGPILILMVIAIFSFRLLYKEHDMPKPFMTVKVTGRQWNWDYEYPDQKIAAYTSQPMDEAAAKASNVPYLLASTAPMVVPVNQVVHVDVVAEDVIHSFSVPAFGIKIDAVPGRMNETWFKAEKTGTYYGQCSQLCGINHAFMPIEVRVVSQADFDAWVASKATKPAAAPAAAPAAGSPAVAAAH